MCCIGRECRCGHALGLSGEDRVTPGQRPSCSDWTGRAGRSPPQLQEPALTQRPHEKGAGPGPGRHPHPVGMEPWATWRGQSPSGFPTASEASGHLPPPQGSWKQHLCCWAPPAAPWALTSGDGPDGLGASADSPGVRALGEGAPQMRSRPVCCPHKPSSRAQHPGARRLGNAPPSASAGKAVAET